jgi:hypothetical protein
MLGTSPGQLGTDLFGHSEIDLAARMNAETDEHE